MLEFLVFLFAESDGSQWLSDGRWGYVGRREAVVIMEDCSVNELKTNKIQFGRIRMLSVIRQD